MAPTCFSLFFFPLFFLSPTPLTLVKNIFALISNYLLSLLIYSSLIIHQLAVSQGLCISLPCDSSATLEICFSPFVFRMGKMKAARTSRRHTPLSNTGGTRSSNRIAAKKETKGTKQAGPSQKRAPPAPRDRSSSQETLKNSSDSSQEPPFSSFSSYNTNEYVELPTLAPRHLLNTIVATQLRRSREA